MIDAKGERRSCDTAATSIAARRSTSSVTGVSTAHITGDFALLRSAESVSLQIEGPILHAVFPVPRPVVRQPQRMNAPGQHERSDPDQVKTYSGKTETPSSRDAFDFQVS